MPPSATGWHPGKGNEGAVLRAYGVAQIFADKFLRRDDSRRGNGIMGWNSW